MSRTPRNVKKQAKEAAELQKQLNTDPAEVAPIDAKPVEVSNEVKPVDDSTQNLQPTPPDKSAQGDDWEKRFKGMKSAYDREVPKLREELSDSHRTIETMQVQIDEIKESMKTPVSPEPEAVTAAETEQYGEGLIEVIQKVADQKVAAKDAELIEMRKKLTDIQHNQENIKKDINVNAEEAFIQELTNRVPTWREKNVDEGFMDYLDEIVAGTGQKRHHFLLEARKKLDIKIVSEIFSAYKGKTPDVPLSVPEELVSPDTSGGGKPPVEQAKVYTYDEVSNFYSDKSKGYYKGKEEEARKIEKDIIAAGPQGRIVERQARVSA